MEVRVSWSMRRDNILTNEHVIRGQSRLTVVFDDGARRIATIVASDATRDIAVLKVTAAGELTVLRFATSVRVGEEVFALGYPSKGFANIKRDRRHCIFAGIDPRRCIHPTRLINQCREQRWAIAQWQRSRRRNEYVWMERRRSSRHSLCNQVRCLVKPLHGNESWSIVAADGCADAGGDRCAVTHVWFSGLRVERSNTILMTD